MIILKIHIIVSSYDQNISFFILMKIDSMSGCDIRLVFTFPPKDSTLQTQYKKNAHTSEITFLALVPSALNTELEEILCYESWIKHWSPSNTDLRINLISSSISHGITWFQDQAFKINTQFTQKLRSMNIFSCKNHK